MMKNQTRYTFLLTFVVLITLLMLYYLPKMSIFGHPLRQIDMLSDIRLKEPLYLSDSDSVALPIINEAVFIDSCKSGITCIEDFSSDSVDYGMNKFYNSLNSLSKNPRPVRIAFLGDSFIEGDILTGELRKLLQHRFGGHGIGWVDITSKTAGFRTSVNHTFGGWRRHSRNDTCGFNRSIQGISEKYFIGSSSAFVDLKLHDKMTGVSDTCDITSIYYSSPNYVPMNLFINNEDGVHTMMDGGRKINKKEFRGKINKVRWQLQEYCDSTYFYGVALDAASGISLDNFSLRGSSGITLAGVSVDFLRNFNELRSYDLIILEYGLNVASPRCSNYTYYQKSMKKVISHFKLAFPNSSILLLGVGDREFKNENGDMATMSGVKNLIRYQQAIASDNSIAFWNLFQAMGGEGSMSRMVSQKKANYDYTHINYNGGKYLASLLYESLIFGYEQFNKKQKYEKINH